MSLQTIVSRNIDPQDATVVTVGFFKAGSAYNVIPGEAHIGGTTRTTTPENRALAQRRIKEICDGAAQMYGVQVEVEHRPGYPPTVNNPEKTKFAIEVAADVCGGHAVRDNVQPSMGAEDFSYMLEKVPGAMVMLGNGGSEAINLHNPRYDFNDMAIPFGDQLLRARPSSASSANRRPEGGGPDRTMEFFRVYGRVIGLLRDERWLAIMLALANVAVAALQFYEPVLFGRVVDLLSNAKSESTDALWATRASCSCCGRPSASAASFPTSWCRCRPTAWRIAGGSAPWRTISSTSCCLPFSFHTAQHSGRLLKIMLTGVDHLFGIWLSLLPREPRDLRGAVHHAAAQPADELAARPAADRADRLLRDRQCLGGRQDRPPAGRRSRSITASSPAGRAMRWATSI